MRSLVVATTELIRREQPGPGGMVSCCEHVDVRSSLVRGHCAWRLLHRGSGDLARKLGEEGVGLRALATGIGRTDTKADDSCCCKNHGLHCIHSWLRPCCWVGLVLLHRTICDAAEMGLRAAGSSGGSRIGPCGIIMGSRLRRGSTPPGRQAHAVPYRTVIPAVKKLIRAPMLVSTHPWRFGERF